MSLPTALFHEPGLARADKTNGIVMDKEVIAGMIGGAFGLIGSVLSIWATVVAHNVRREMQVKLLEPQLDAYRKLWSLMEVASPSLEQEWSLAERASLESTLRGWYYAAGNGIFLSKESRALLVGAKEALLDGKIHSDKIRKALSSLRSQMKNDIGVYGKEDLTSLSKI
jgi:hypothetical protein